MNSTLADFARVCGGTLMGADAAYTGVSTDTRTLSGGQLFIALTGERFNGDEFVAQAEKAGAVGAVVRVPQAVSIPQIVVPDTTAALARAANAWRESFSIPVVGVAGSNGKTTVKGMIASILGQAGETLSTQGNLNNHIGVPLTLFRLTAAHRFAVVEMGADKAGEVATLVKIGRPTVGLITNAGAEHLEGFLSMDGVACAEGEMVEGLASDATAIINADDTYAGLWRGMTQAKVQAFGLSEGSDFTAKNLHTSVTAEGFLTRYTLHCPLGETAVELHLAGRHNVLNSLCAAAAAAAAGASLGQIAAGLAAMRPVAGRLQFKRALGGAMLIDDSYNANPSSVQAGIEVLEQVSGERWLVFADMGELGEFAEQSHSDIGVFAREHGITHLFATGELARRTVHSFGTGAEWHPDTTALGGAVRAALTQAGAAASEVRMLVKGSRFNRLERVVAALTDAPAGTTGEH